MRSLALTPRSDDHRGSALGVSILGGRAGTGPMGRVVIAGGKLFAPRRRVVTTV
jgi:hypothetical protein